MVPASTHSSPLSSSDSNPEEGLGGARDKAQQAAGHAQENVQQAAGQAQEKAQQAAGQAQAKLRDQIDQRSTQLAEQARRQASDLRSVSGALRDQDQERPAQLADRLAGYAEQAGDYLHDKDADAMLDDAEEFGRQKPAAVAAGALMLGFAASRFLKASSRNRYSTRNPQQRSASRPESPAVPPLTVEPAPRASTRPPSIGSGI